MSNLTLPDMGYVNLAKLMGRATVKRLGYETYAYREVVGSRVGEITIRHHGSAIASLTPDTLTLTHAGYNTSTTTARLHKILIDQTGQNSYGIAIRQGLTSLVGEDRKPIVALSELGGFVSFDKLPEGHWSLSALSQKRIAEARELVVA